MGEVRVTGSDGSTLAFDGTMIEITRKGGFGSSHRKGTKRVPVRTVAAVQFKEPGLTVGFIQFTIGSDQKSLRKGGSAMDAVKDENAVVFNRKGRDEFARLRDLIDAAMASPIDQARSRSAAPASHTGSLSDELIKLVALRDSGVLTEQEFATQKARLLA